MYVEVAVNLPSIRGTFHYHLSPSLRGKVGLGHLVTVPFGKRRAQGVVVGMPKKPAVAETRPVEDLLDLDPVLTSGQLELARWMAVQNHAPLAECLTLMLPPGLSQQTDSLYQLTETDLEGNTPTQERVINLLQRRGPLRGRQIARALSRQNWRQAVKGLVQRGSLIRTSVLDPPRAKAKKVRTARLSVAVETAQDRLDDLGRRGSQAAQRRREIMKLLIESSESLNVPNIYAKTNGNLADLRLLERRGLITLSSAEVWRDPLADLDYVPIDPPELTSDQSGVWSQIESIMGDPSDVGLRAILLHGVTGSGKTEIYMRAVSKALGMGQSAIVLVPEIALTPQTIRRFLARFPDRIGIYHSQLSDGERFDTWRRCRGGQLQLIVGPRSALFTPFQNLGLIVVDESHDESYKEQGRAPRYHARETALAYSQIMGATCLLGSATPDVVISYRAQKGDIIRLSLPQRIYGHHERLARQASRLGVKSRYKSAEGDARFIDLPPVRVVDMRHELKTGNTSIFSRALQQALDDTLSANEQVILFLNRRGSSTYVFCRDCGWVARCPRCETPLTHHAKKAELTCHHCGYKRKPFQVCPNCESRRVRHFGAGTQRVETELKQTFPGVRTLRWDWDTTRRKGAHDQILTQFVEHQAEVLVGTQMIAKGLDLPLVTLVGVVSADIGLYMPDYRAGERTFQVLTQVAGRAGRGLLGGRVILQTYQPDHYAIRAAASHDYESFYLQELRERKDYHYPPFSRLARLIFHSVSNLAAEEMSERMAKIIGQKIEELGSQASLIGPAPCFYHRIRGEYRWQLIIRAADPSPLIPDELPKGWSIDLDPVRLL